jgi:hypothetical protein
VTCGVIASVYFGRGAGVGEVLHGEFITWQAHRNKISSLFDGIKS